MDQIVIQAAKRQVSGKQVKTLRIAGKLPAVLYGHNVENQSIEIGEKDFGKVFKQAGESTLVNLVVDGKAQSVLIHEVQYHYLNGLPMHVDFYAVDLTEKLKVHVPIHFVGEAPAVKALGGILSKNLSEIEVECLPADIPQAFAVDISSLNTFEDVIRVSDIKVSGKVSVLDKPEELVVSVAPPRTEEELKSLNEEVKEDVTAVEGVVKPEAPVEGVVASESAKGGATSGAKDKSEKAEKSAKGGSASGGKEEKK